MDALFVPDGPPRFAGLCFDLDDTLVDRGASFERALDQLARRFPSLRGGALDELRALDARGRGDREVLCRQAVARSPELGSPEAFARMLLAAIAEHVRPRPEVTALLEGLAEQHRLAVVSNGGPRQREKLARAGLERFFARERVLISCEVGCEKPDPRIFERALAALELGAAEVLHVGDDPARDIVGAHGAGLASCWVSHGAVYPEGLPPPTFSVTELPDLPARIEAA